MNQLDSRIRPYALEAGEGWTYRFGIDFTVKAGEVQAGSSSAILEYLTRKDVGGEIICKSSHCE